MAIPFGQAAFTGGEVSPSLFGRFDIAKYHVACGTARNFFIRYQGGMASRAGTAFVGFSKQTGRSYPPRMVPFQFNINQGLALEFGDFYMRVIENGAFVTEPAVAITGASQTDPVRVTHSGTSGTLSATSINTGVISSYAPGDQVTMAGGTYISPAVLGVTNTLLLDLNLNSPGADGYVPADTLSLTGGTQTTPAELTVDTTQVVSATIAVGGAGGSAGTQTVTGTTGTGTMFEALVTVAAGTITAVLSISVGGSYTVEPTVLAAEPVTGGGLVGAQLNVKMGIETFSITDAGVFTANPSGLAFVQNTTSGSGVGATFQFALMAPNALSVVSAGSYTTLPSNPVSQASTTGTGSGATFTLTTGSAPAFANDDWVKIAAVNGMTELNGQTFVIGNVTSTTFDLFNVYGELIDGTGYDLYTGGGTASRIYTVVSPYAEEDLRFLKWAQSADVMSLCLVNQDTDVEYAAYDLGRFGATDWRFEAFDPVSSMPAPQNPTGSASSVGTTDYNYVVTAVGGGEESLQSGIINVPTAVDIASVAGSITLNWSQVDGAAYYNVYKATPGYNNVGVPVGAQFGFVGIANGTQFIDSNVFPDFSQTPPRNRNPFARGRIIGIMPTAGGSGYTTAAVTVNTSTGTDATFQAAVVGGAVAYYVIFNEGQNYATGDTVTITGDGSGATAVITIGPESGTYPSTVNYFQQRRVYANTLTLPDTYFMSQPGAYHNFDVRIPPIDSDAITGSPWGVKVDGIQFLVDMPGGLIALTGTVPCQLTGAGGSSFNPQPITPASQTAQPQGQNGCHDHIPPIKIESTYLYVQSKGAIVRDASYSFNTNIYAGADITLNSSHLFNGQQIREWAYAEEPFKVVWAVREDGILLALTYVRMQEIAGWTRNDTNGLFRSVCSITELPTDAVYFAVERSMGVHDAYTIERMDDRLWTAAETDWCVDCGLTLGRPTPAATIRASSARGLGAISGVTDLVGGSGYSAGTTATVVDDEGRGPGTGAVAALTFAGGVITGVTFSPEGSGYTYPALVISDPAGSDGGSGASATLVLDNSATFTADSGVFSSGDIGDVIRMGGGIATITGFTSSTTVVANITSPITTLTPNSGGLPQPALSGTWSMTTPVTEINGLQHLAGATVTGLYDGKVLDPTVVPDSGTVTLPEAATYVTIGLGFRAQLQSIYADPPGVTAQGQRKALPEVTVRIQDSRGMTVGTNQVDGSTLSPMQIEVEWTQMKDVPNNGRAPYGSNVPPLFTGDVNTSVMGGFATPGQVAVQQDLPLACNVLAFIPSDLPGDPPETDQSALQMSRRRRGQG